MKRKRYALVGTGSRSYMYSDAIFGDHKDVAELVAVCDSNPVRMQYANEEFGRKFGASPVPMYRAHEFEKMIAEKKPDVVIVTSMDRTHHEYIIKSMELGCDVVTEKPMTIDEEKAQDILDTVERTGRQLTVTFNYRYSPRNTKVKELIMNGEIGDVLSIHFEWLLDTTHGADYFRRWHRDKANSGGLLVHKSTHHFDLVNWWIASQPKTVFAMGRLGFYGRQNAEKRGVTEFYERAYGSEVAKKDPFAIHLEKDDNLKRMYLEAEKVRRIPARSERFRIQHRHRRYDGRHGPLQKQGNHDLLAQRTLPMGRLPRHVQRYEGQTRAQCKGTDLCLRFG